MLNTRGCGILLHPTSLPGPGGIGLLGADARRFIDLLQAMGMSYWQMLPLTPPACGNSPYMVFSAFGGNPLLIGLEEIVAEGDLADTGPACHYSKERVDFTGVVEHKMDLLHRAGTAFLAEKEPRRRGEFRQFCDTTPWLDDFALFTVLKHQFDDKSWSSRPEEEACIAPESSRKYLQEFAHEIALEKYLQWQFARQWRELRAYAHERGIAMIGDIPIYVAHDSADVWSHRELFLLDARGKPTVVAGVPPDYFTTTGQLWGNPHYNWEALAQDGYSWWIDRFKANFALFDIVRVDHFRGFEAAWQVPATAATAERGMWVEGPGERFFDTLLAELGPLAVIAEDLGVITPAVDALRDRYHFPGMKILQFAFDSGPSDLYLPHNHIKNMVVYTGTHDNDTSRGWYDSLTEAERGAMNVYLGTSGDDCVDGLMRAALMSVADTAIIPFQDILKLGNEARMNLPGTAFGNWEWRFSWDMLPHGLAASVRAQVERYGRVQQGGTSHAA